MRSKTTNNVSGCCRGRHRVEVVHEHETNNRLVVEREKSKHKQDEKQKLTRTISRTRTDRKQTTNQTLASITRNKNRIVR